MSTDRITIKGTSDGLIVTIGAGAWPSLVEELDHHLGQKASFFKGGRVAVRLGPRQLTRPQIEAVGQILTRHGVTLWAVESTAPGTQEATEELGLETSIVARRVPPPEPPAEGDSLVVQRTLRSGQVIHHPGHIVIIGDVNPGAEIRAGRSVIIWGRLRGTVQAGTHATEDERVVVCALEMAPTQLRIGEHIARPPASEDDLDVGPEVAFIQDDQIVAEPWQ